MEYTKTPTSLLHFTICERRLLVADRWPYRAAKEYTIIDDGVREYVGNWWTKPGKCGIMIELNCVVGFVHERDPQYKEKLAPWIRKYPELLI